MSIGNRSLYQNKNEGVANVLNDAAGYIHKSQKTFYVDSNTGNTAYSGQRIQAPLPTIAAAMASCTASQGDRIFVLPQHAETVTSTITFKAGVRLIGLSVGNLRPVITINGATDLFSLAGANSQIENLELTIATTDAATSLIDVTAAKCHIRNIKMIPSTSGSVNVVDCITIASGANDLTIDDVRIHNTTTPVNSFISIEAAVARLRIMNCYMSGDLVTAGIIDAATATQILLLNNIVKTIGTNIPGCILDSNPTGEAIGNYMLGTDATIANNAQWGSALILANNYTRGGTGSTVSATNISPSLDT